MNPSIFISATSGDLHSARDIVAKILTSLGYNPVWQDIAATDAGNLSEVLRSWIKPCAAVIQLVGLRYGAEPRQPDATFGRASYTQLEALYAEQMKKRVIYIFLPENFPVDPCQLESPDKLQLQADYRQRLKDSGVLRHSASSPLELENRVLRIRDDLALLRAEMEKSRRRLWWVAGIGLLLLGGIGWGVWSLTKSSGDVKTGISGITKTQDQQNESLDHLKQDSQHQGVIAARIETKIDEIRALPANLRADRLATALAAANADELSSLRAAGITTLEVQNALARQQTGGTIYIAELFFRSSRNVPEAIAWLRTVLKDGLDPNMTVPDTYFVNRALLTYAIRTGNVAAAIALLEGGASPHPFQNLWLTTNDLPIFLFPYNYLMENEALDADEKVKLAKALQKAGAAATRYQPGVTDTKSYTGDRPAQCVAMEKVFEASPDVFGFKLEETPPLSQTSDSPIARALGKQGEVWQKFLMVMPITIQSVDRADFGPFWVEVRNFIGAYSGRGYFIGVANDEGEGPKYALIEVSKDFRAWSVYLYIGTRAGMGFAKGNNGEQSYGSRDAAWRRFSFKYVPEKNEMSLQDYYKYKTTREVSPHP